jgi:uncharacterized protein
VVTPFTTRGDSPTAISAATTLPAMYRAEVTHTRRTPVVNRFRYTVNYWLVDYDQLACRTGIASRLVRFEPSDHADIRATLVEHGVDAKRVLMLAMPRAWGYVFNPISVFWCYDAFGDRVAVLAEVHNTYGGRHVYFLQPDEHRWSTVEKKMYVSPFYPVDGHYNIRVSEPGAEVAVTVTLRREGEAPFVATLRGIRVTANTRNVVRAYLTRPALRASLLIRWQALRLWARGLKVQPR